MKYVIPMAGHGSRFTAAGLTTPKPLLKVQGRTFLEHSLVGLPIQRGDDLIFITQRAHDIPMRLRPILQQSYPQVRQSWLEIDGVTDGQLCTVLLAKDQIDLNEALIIHNCDTYFQSGIADVLRDSRFAGALSCARVEGDKWSFARVGDSGDVVETSEKVRISPWASVGLYYFQSGSIFVKYAEAMVRENERWGREFYVAPLYNRLIRDGARIALDSVREFKPLGTPEDLVTYWNTSIIDLAANSK